MSTDADLIAGFLAGDAGCHRTIDGWIRAVLFSRRLAMGPDGEDVAQDVRRKLLVLLREGRFRGDASLCTYVWRMAQTAAIDHLRRRLRRPVAPLEDAAEPVAPGDPESSLQRAQREAMFRDVWQRLGAECRRLWSLIVYEELSYAAIASRMDLTEGAVKVRALRCRRQAAEIAQKLVTSPSAPRQIRKSAL